MKLKQSVYQPGTNKREDKTMSIFDREVSALVNAITEVIHITAGDYENDKEKCNFAFNVAINVVGNTFFRYVDFVKHVYNFERGCNTRIYKCGWYAVVQKCF